MDAVYNYLEYKKTPVEAGRTDYMSHRQTSTPELEDFSIRQESRGARGRSLIGGIYTYSLCLRD